MFDWKVEESRINLTSFALFHGPDKKHFDTVICTVLFHFYVHSTKYFYFRAIICRVKNRIEKHRSPGLRMF